jgi:predicted transcriptional regulator
MKNSDVTTVRLSGELDRKLEVYSDLRNTTKSDIVKEALRGYFARIESESDSWEVGESYFGRYGSGDGTLSATYKRRIKEKLHDKHTR